MTNEPRKGSLTLVNVHQRLPAPEWVGYFVHNGEYRFGCYDEGEPGQFGRPSWYDKFGRSDLKPKNVSHWVNLNLPPIPDDY